MDRKLIRKLILKEMRKKIVEKQEVHINELGQVAAVALGGAAAALAAGAAAAYANYKSMPVDSKINNILTNAPTVNFYLMGPASVLDGLASSGNLTLPPGVVVTSLQTELDGAFAGTWEKLAGIDINTDEAVVSEVILKSGSQLAFSKIAASFTTGGQNLLQTLKDEMGNYDWIEYVEKPLLALPFALDGNGNPLSAADIAGFAVAAPSTPPVSLGYGCEARPAVDHIIKTINSYYGIHSLGSGPTGSSWTAAVQSAWLVFVAHALANSTIFSKYGPSGSDAISGSTLGKWQQISTIMIGDFPGYTSNTVGCLAFCIDAYNDTNTCGASANSGGGGGGGGGVGVVPPPKLVKDKDQVAARTYKDIIVKVTSGGETVPLSTVFDETVQKDFIYELEQNFKDSVQKSAVQKSTMQIDLIFGVGFKKVKDVKRRRPVGGSSRINFKGNIQRTFEEFFNSARLARAPEGNLKSYSDKRRMRIEIDIPANYTPTGNRRE